MVQVNIGRYANNRPSITLIDTEDGIPYATASTNLPDVLLLDNEVLIKDYSENIGMLNFLVKNNIVFETGKYVTSGFVEIPVCVLNPETEWGKDPSPQQVDGDKKLWIINGYKVWAQTYDQALEIADQVDAF